MNQNDIKRLEEIYKMLPDIKCKQECSYACGPITMSYGEAERLQQETGAPVKKCDQNLECGYLLEGKNCSIHPIRPILCRLWGVVDTEEMTCPHGCEVVGKKLSQEEAYIIMQLIEMVAGYGTDYIGTHPPDFEKKLAETFGPRRAREMMRVKNPKSTGYR
jgi:Fe-S-cluster containining protein